MFCVKIMFRRNVSITRGMLEERLKSTGLGEIKMTCAIKNFSKKLFHCTIGGIGSVVLLDV